MTRFDVLVSWVVAVVLTPVCFFLLATSYAEVRSSASYSLESDSLNFAGGFSTSSTYQLESTVGEIATGRSSSTGYALKAGYQQMQSVFISLSAPTTLTLMPAIGGLTGGSASGSATVSVLTDSPSGYSLSIAALSSPAMQRDAESIADYVPALFPTPDFSFTTDTNDVHFGFSVEGSDTIDRFRNDGGACNAGISSTQRTCWVGLSTSSILIAEGGANQPSGATTTLYFQVGVGGGVAVSPGEYVATTTITALPL